MGAFLVLSTLSLAGNWSLIQRFYSARNDREAGASAGWPACCSSCLPPVWIFTGMFARAFIRIQGCRIRRPSTRG